MKTRCFTTNLQQNPVNIRAIPTDSKAGKFLLCTLGLREGTLYTKGARARGFARRSFLAFPAIYCFFCPKSFIIRFKDYAIF